MSVPPSCTLRPYQQRLVDKAVAMFLGHSRNGAGELEAAARSVMIESPTGSGKTVIGLHIAKAIGMASSCRTAVTRSAVSSVTSRSECDPLTTEMSSSKR